MAKEYFIRLELLNSLTQATKGWCLLVSKKGSLMERKSCCSGRSCCPSTQALRPAVTLTPKKEPVVTVKTPKAEDVKTEVIKEVEGHHANAAVKVEKKETGNATAVKKEEALKVNVGCGLGACN
ncbi:hypothetical protein DCAR_0831555 [Daucus carota subsp. sativus]|uniref:Uncharacterized protein n=1 Tax=Daucus carota subsp. sativus TaxID=79200 RepID=A0AAF0XPU8_DAUCS|nr:hypothetical protein DCAR_0831555 [Daucus carota subsp. sativus]